MNASRAKVAESAMKEIQSLGKTVGAPKAPESTSPSVSAPTPTPLNDKGISEPAHGMGLLQVFMYLIAGILLIGILLLFVDYFVTPIFQKTPGGDGYIPIPGSDTSNVFWKKLPDVTNIHIGAPPPPNPNSPGAIAPPSTQAIEQQSSFTITMDVLIADEFPQNLGPNAETYNISRTFFALGQPFITTSTSIKPPFLTASLDNKTNLVKITLTGDNNLIQSVILDNVPIHTPFRIGIVKTPTVLEGYLNGQLVQTTHLRIGYPTPNTGDLIIAGANISYKPPLTSAQVAASVQATPINLSKGISVLNVRVSGNAINPAEMKYRMRDLYSVADFGIVTPPAVSTLPTA